MCVMECTCCLVCVMVVYLLSYVCHIIFIVNLSPSSTGGADNYGKVINVTIMFQCCQDRISSIFKINGSL